MSELFAFLGTIRAVGWVYLIALSAVATGFFLFDSRAKGSAAQESEKTTRRRAA